MPNDMIIMGMARGLAKAPAARWPLTLLLRAGWILGKLTLAGLLLTYMAGWVHDLQRMTHLEAQPTPPFKIISKQQAWQRIYKQLPR